MDESDLGGRPSAESVREKRHVGGRHPQARQDDSHGHHEEVVRGLLATKQQARRQPTEHQDCNARDEVVHDLPAERAAG